MTKENAKDFLPLVQALADGKVIEYRSTAGIWIPANYPNFAIEDPSLFRIKPEPVRVPLGPEDVPPGSLLRRANELVEWFLIYKVNSPGLCVLANFYDWNKLMRDGFQIKRPGQDWTPCYKES